MKHGYLKVRYESKGSKYVIVCTVMKDGETEIVSRVVPADSVVMEKEHEFESSIPVTEDMKDGESEAAIAQDLGRQIAEYAVRNALSPVEYIPDPLNSGSKRCVAKVKVIIPSR